MKETIAFVGVGRMGANMARRLKDKGYSVTAVYDHLAPLATALAGEIGAEACKTLARVTELASVIITVVTDDNAMRAIFADQGDSLLVGAKGKLFVNCATVSPQVHLDVEALTHKVGAESLEACMASSITQAREGSLYLMTGGWDAAFQRAEPILKDLSVSLRHIGATGQAAQVKALVNMVMNINTAGLAEGLGLGAALGLDLTMLREVFSQTGADSRVLKTDGEDMQNRDHSCFFSGAHAAKDSGIALMLAHKKNLNLPLAEATKTQYDRMVSEGLGDLDKSGIAELTFPGRSKTGTNPEPIHGPTNPTPEDAAKAPVKYYGSIIELRPEKEKEYCELHANVWPEVRAAIAKANIRNFNIYVTEIAGKRLLVSHLEYIGTNPEQDFASIGNDPATKNKWWPLTDACQIRLPGTPEGSQWLGMRQVMHLD